VSLDFRVSLQFEPKEAMKQTILMVCADALNYTDALRN
jgi:hypothetical protein